MRAPGFDYECVATGDHAPERFRAAAEAGYEVGESMLRSLLLELQAGEAPRALPVFFGREHMQRNVVVTVDSPLSHPRELVGTRIGSRQPPASGTNIGVLMMLEQAYGVPLAEIAWSFREPENLPVNRMHLKIESGPSTNAACFERLLRGELDAVIVGGGPRYWSLFGPDSVDEEIKAYPQLRTLITAPKTIAETYRRTGLYPITDFVVLAPGLAAQHPDLPAQLVEVFSIANARSSDYRSPEEERLAQREIELLGQDPHRYGLGPNPRHNLTALIAFLYRLGAIERPVEPEAIFAPGAVTRV